MKRQYGMLIAAVAAAGTVLLMTGAGVKAGPQANKLEGAWVAKVPGSPIQWGYTITPLDPSGRRASIATSLHVRIPGEVFFAGVIPPADYFTPFVGEAVMTGPDTAKFTAVSYAIQKVSPTESYPFFEKVAFICMTSGELKFTGPGKVEATHHIANYWPTADADGDGLPDAGQTPFICLPPTTSIDTRVALVAPCNP